MRSEVKHKIFQVFKLYFPTIRFPIKVQEMGKKAVNVHKTMQNLVAVGKLLQIADLGSDALKSNVYVKSNLELKNTKNKYYIRNDDGLSINGS